MKDLVPSISTPEFDLASFLEAKGANLLLVDRGQSGKIIYIFEKTPVTRRLQDCFKAGQREVDASRYAAASRYLASLAKGIGKASGTELNIKKPRQED